MDWMRTVRTLQMVN